MPHRVSQLPQRRRTGREIADEIFPQVFRPHSKGEDAKHWVDEPGRRAAPARCGTAAVGGAQEDDACYRGQQALGFGVGAAVFVGDD